MEILSYKSKDMLPGIILDKQSGTFQIFGQSCPEDAVGFYEPIFNWFDQYAKNPLKSTTMDFKMTYFNTISAKVILMIMTKLEDLSNSGKDVKVRWFYADEDQEEAGEEFGSIVDLKFECIPVKDVTDQSIDEEDFNDFMDEFI